MRLCFPLRVYSLPWTPALVGSALAVLPRSPENSWIVWLPTPGWDGLLREFQLFCWVREQGGLDAVLTLTSTFYFSHRNFDKLPKVKGLRDASWAFPESFSIHIYKSTPSTTSSVHMHVELWAQVQFLFTHLQRGLMAMLVSLTRISEIPLGIGKAGRLGDSVLREKTITYIEVALVTGYLSQNGMVLGCFR